MSLALSLQTVGVHLPIWIRSNWQSKWTIKIESLYKLFTISFIIQLSPRAWPGVRPLPLSLSSLRIWLRMARGPARGPPLTPNSSLSLHTVPYQTVVSRSNLGKHTFTSTSLKRTPKNRVQPRLSPVNPSDLSNWYARSVFVNCDVVVGLPKRVFLLFFLLFLG